MTTATSRSAAQTPDGAGISWSDDLASAALTMAAVLASFGGMYGLSQVADVPTQALVLAVVLALTLSRMLSRAQHSSWLVVLEVPVLGVIATCAGWLMVREPWIGQPLLVVALCLGVLTRRWEGLVKQAGRLVSLPFLVLLIAPVPRLGPDRVPSLQVSSMLWGAAAGLLASVCAVAAQLARTRLVPTDLSASRTRTVRRARRLDAGTRSAVQLSVALGSALALGHVLFGAHWPWVVVSAYLVMSGARGRGDVVHKAGLRVAGASVGTVVATLATSHGLPAGNRWLIVAIFAVMAGAVLLRNRSYAFWAAGVTAMIALLSGFYGQPSAHALSNRVLGVLLGSVLGVAAAWFVVPVRTSDVLRRYLADCLAALTDDLDPRSDAPSRTPAALRSLHELGPALRAHRKFVSHRPEPHPVDAIAALQRLARRAADDHEQPRLRRDIVRVRRAIVGKDDPAPEDLPPDLATVHRVIQTTRTDRARPQKR